MKYSSTRGKEVLLSPSEALIQGIAKDGGLLVPAKKDVKFEATQFLNKEYCQVAAEVLTPYFSGDGIDISVCVNNAYGQDHFYGPSPVCMTYTDSKMFLELYHGKTAAFKDMALSLLPYLMAEALRVQNIQQRIMILTATSGDTGKSALEAFADQENIDIVVFYPEEGVSAVQKRHMQSQKGKNVYVFGIRGNFDDAQNAVKKAFDSEEIRQNAQECGVMLSSANSINVGRLFPQTVYYWWAYSRLIEDNKIQPGEKINFCVPTGNFGNILAGYYASLAGLPVHRFICASNENNVLTDFIESGIYDKNRPFKKTISPSMDILISSNLERLLYHLGKNDGEYVSQLMQQLREKGRYEISASMYSELRSKFYGGFATEDQIKEMIRKTFEEEQYLIDTHTAAAAYVYEVYRQQTKDTTPTVILSTASAYKFADNVLHAVTRETKDSFEAIEALEKVTNVPMHPALKSIAKAELLHTQVCDIEEIIPLIKKLLRESR